MKKKKLTITEADYLLANRRASREEEIEAHGHPVRSRTMVHRSKKVYDRNLIKRAAIKRDDSSFHIEAPPQGERLAARGNPTPTKNISVFLSQFVLLTITYDQNVITLLRYLQRNRFTQN
ncbi:MAG: hypothetical protein Q8R90_05215 [Bacteroidales bacterium]|nr:hypothetical protein [Bacteroidales bacterium]